MWAWRMTRIAVVLVGWALLVAACGATEAGSDTTATGALTTSSEGVEPGEGSTGPEPTSDEVVDVDDCTLLTDEEVSSLAGTALLATEDSFLGCGYVGEGEVVADFSIRSYSAAGASAAELGAELAPSANVIPLDGVGDEAVALEVDGSVNFLLARSDDLVVEMVMTFLDVTPDSPELERASELAVLALGRLAEAG